MIKFPREKVIQMEINKIHYKQLSEPKKIYIGASTLKIREKLNIAFDLYKGIVTEINKNIKPFYPTISHLCLFLGINTREWNAYRNNVDIDMRDLITTIDDWIFDITMRLSEKKAIDNKTSMYRAKIEQNRVEQTAPNTVLIADGATIQEIQKRVKQLRENIK